MNQSTRGQRRELDRLEAPPRPAAMDEFGFVEPVDGLCEGIVVAVADTANGGFNASLCHALGVADADVLRSAVAMVDEPSFASWPSLMEGLLERVQNKAGMGSPANPPGRALAAPPAAESGLPGFEVSTWNGLFAPRGLPPAIRDRLSAAMDAALADPGVQARLLELGFVRPAPAERGGEVLGGLVAREIPRWAAVLKEAGIAPE